MKTEETKNIQKEIFKNAQVIGFAQSDINFCKVTMVGQTIYYEFSTNNDFVFKSSKEKRFILALHDRLIWRNFLKIRGRIADEYNDYKMIVNYINKNCPQPITEIYFDYFLENDAHSNNRVYAIFAIMKKYVNDYILDDFILDSRIHCFIRGVNFLLDLKENSYEGLSYILDNKVIITIRNKIRILHFDEIGEELRNHLLVCLDGEDDITFNVKSKEILKDSFGFENTDDFKLFIISLGAYLWQGKALI